MTPLSFAACCDVQVTNPLTIPTTGSMALDPTVSKRGRGDVGRSVGVLFQSTHVASGTRKSGWTWSFSQNAVMTRRPLACEKKNISAFMKRSIFVFAQTANLFRVAIVRGSRM